MTKMAPPRKSPKEIGLQTLAVSAALTKATHALLSRYAPNHVSVNLNTSLEMPQGTTHIAYSVSYRKKKALLEYLLRRRRDRGSQLVVFVRTQQRADTLANSLVADGFPSAAVHSGVSMSQRKARLEAFVNGKVQALVTTDALSRGIDIRGLPLVVNYDIPHIAEDYIHRAGRTGRMGEKGVVYSLVSKDVVEVELGSRALAIDERVHMDAIVRLLGEKAIEFRKVPGHWRDDDEGGGGSGNVNGSGSSSGGSASYKKEKRSYLTRRGFVTFRPQDAHVGEPSQRWRKDGKGGPSVSKVQKVHSSGEPDSGGATLISNLREHRESRYEVVVRSFDEKRATKRGVATPSVRGRARGPSSASPSARTSADTSTTAATSSSSSASSSFLSSRTRTSAARPLSNGKQKSKSSASGDNKPPNHTG